MLTKDALVTDGLPEEFDSHSVEYLDYDGLVARYRKLGKSFATLVIRPMQNEGPILKVAVVVYWVSYKNHRLQLGPSDWSNVEFRYERDQQRFLVSGVKHSFRSGILIVVAREV